MQKITVAFDGKEPTTEPLRKKHKGDVQESSLSSSSLPDYVLQEIFFYFTYDFASLKNISFVSKQWHRQLNPSHYTNENTKEDFSFISNIARVALLKLQSYPFSYQKGLEPGATAIGRVMAYFRSYFSKFGGVTEEMNASLVDKMTQQNKQRQSEISQVTNLSNCFAFIQDSAWQTVRCVVNSSPLYADDSKNYFLNEWAGDIPTEALEKHYVVAFTKGASRNSFLFPMELKNKFSYFLDLFSRGPSKIDIVALGSINKESQIQSFFAALKEKSEFSEIRLCTKKNLLNVIGTRINNLSISFPLRFCLDSRDRLSFNEVSTFISQVKEKNIDLFFWGQTNQHYYGHTFFSWSAKEIEDFASVNFGHIRFLQFCLTPLKDSQKTPGLLYRELLKSITNFYYAAPLNLEVHVYIEQGRSETAPLLGPAFYDPADLDWFIDRPAINYSVLCYLEEGSEDIYSALDDLRDAKDEREEKQKAILVKAQQ